MQALLRVSRGIDQFTEWVGRLTLWLVPLVLAVGIWNVANRYVGRAIGMMLGSNVFIELQWYIYSLIFLLAASYALKHGEHVRVDVLSSRYSPRTAALVEMIGTALFLFPFCIALLYFSWPFVAQSWFYLEQSPDAAGLPRYPLKTVIMISPLLLMIQGVSIFIKNLAVYRGVIAPPQTDHESAL
jgi:TRAP-type mannitol/chloroaromatic compound transport system permease small subunit